MTVNQLRKLIANLPGEMLVVTPGSDHSYDMGGARVDKAEILRNSKRGHVIAMGEYYDERNRASGTSTIEQVLVVGSG